MAVDAAPSGKAQPGRLRLEAATRALATALPVTACGVTRRQQCRPDAVGPHSAHAGGRQLHHSRCAPASSST